MNVFIVEDTAIMHVSLQSMLSGIPDITVIGHAKNEQQALESIDALQPDVVVLDIGLQSGPWFDVLENIKKRHAGIKAMVLTDSADELFIGRCKNAGADYIFDKSFQFMQIRAAFWKWLHTDRFDNKPDAIPVALGIEDSAAYCPWGDKYHAQPYRSDNA